MLVISHPNVVPHNQLVYSRLAELGWEVKLIVPNRWVDEYSPGGFVPEPLEGLVGTFARVRVARPGAIQRHLYVTRPSRWLSRWRPQVAFLEQEPFSLPALQWGLACRTLRDTVGAAGRREPRPTVSLARSGHPGVGDAACRVLCRAISWRRRHARALGRPRADRDRAAHAARVGASGATTGGPFTIGFAGRLVEAKGLRDLVAAARKLDFDFRLLIVGDGPLREELGAAHLGRGVLALRTGVRSAEMPALYAEMDVLVLPSRTTVTWAEQFGKVLCEALLCGTPVVGSSSGEIPWVIETTRGGRIFPEGDASALAAVLSGLHADPACRAGLASAGRVGVERHFLPRIAARKLDGLLRGAL